VILPELPPVEYTAELRRVLMIPRRTSPPEGTEDLSSVLGTGILRPIQAQALAELHLLRGLIAPLTVGGGKTLISYLTPRMVGSERPLLLIPANLRDKTRRDFDDLRKKWVTTIEPIVCSYQTLGRTHAADFLTTYQPDLIIADEAHRLKNPRAAVTRRVGRYMDAHPDTVFVALSGTMTKRSLADFAHIAEWCLGDGAPVPLTRYELEQWCQALDEEGQWSDSRRAPGALLDLGHPDVREGFRRRLVETPGVVASVGSDVDASLVITKWQVSVLPEVAEALKHLDAYWETPDGHPLISAADVWRHARELSLGFWCRWEPAPPEDWMQARRDWAAFARGVLSRSRNLDSEAQVAAKHKDSPEYQRWISIKDTYSPASVVEWITDYYVQEAMRWAYNHEGIIWVGRRAIGHALEARGLPYYANMGRDSRGRFIEDATGTIVASIDANFEGRNLQRYSKNLILWCPTTGDRLEQLLGRTHREGQKEDEVSVEVHLGCRQSAKGFEQAVSDARYQKGVLGAPQKLLLADIGV
jgi:hypothetical protein